MQRGFTFEFASPQASTMPTSNQSNSLACTSRVVWCNVLQCVAVCCSVLQCVAVCCSVLQCVAMCCSHQEIWPQTYICVHILKPNLFFCVSRTATYSNTLQHTATHCNAQTCLFHTSLPTSVFCSWVSFIGLFWCLSSSVTNRAWVSHVGLFWCL